MTAAYHIEIYTKSEMDEKDSGLSQKLYFNQIRMFQLCMYLQRVINVWGIY